MVRTPQPGSRHAATLLERGVERVVFALAIALIHVSVILLTTAGVPDYAPRSASHPEPPWPAATLPGPAGPAQYRHRDSLAAATPAAGGMSGLLDSPPWP
jgi:hypothetical protein